MRILTAWRPIVVVTILVTLIGFLGDSGREMLAYDRQGIASGQLWRLVSGHFVHAGVPHMLLNLAGLWLVWYLVGRSIDGLGWLLVWLAAIAGVDLGLWFLDPGLAWYVGLSGVLHGLLAAGLVTGLRSPSLESGIVLVGLVGKLAYEQLSGPLPGSEDTTGIAVIVNAHLYGAVGGAICGLILGNRVRDAASI